MVLQEIFKTNPGLLDQPEVKKLIEYVSEQHRKNADRFFEIKNRESEALMKVYESEIFVINGRPAKEALHQIADILK
jgi:hypothetical protein